VALHRQMTAQLIADALYAAAMRRIEMRDDKKAHPRSYHTERTIAHRTSTKLMPTVHTLAMGEAMIIGRLSPIFQNQMIGTAIAEPVPIPAIYRAIPWTDIGWPKVRIECAK
jgi:hypothetical protein